MVAPAGEEQERQGGVEGGQPLRQLALLEVAEHLQHARRALVERPTVHVSVPDQRRDPRQGQPVARGAVRLQRPVERRQRLVEAPAHAQRLAQLLARPRGVERAASVARAGQAIQAGDRRAVVALRRLGGVAGQRAVARPLQVGRRLLVIGVAGPTIVVGQLLHRQLARPYPRLQRRGHPPVQRGAPGRAEAGLDGLADKVVGEAIGNVPLRVEQARPRGLLQRVQRRVLGPPRRRDEQRHGRAAAHHGGRAEHCLCIR